MNPVNSRLEILNIVPFGQTGPDPQFYAMSLANPQWPSWTPGQFVMLRPQNFNLTHILGRPFSICHVTPRHMVCFFKVAGQGTNLMSQLKAGDHVDVWGPLGNGFDFNPAKKILILAGGMGIVPFIGYILRHHGASNLEMIFGHREPLGCYPVESICEHLPIEFIEDRGPEDLDYLITAIGKKMRQYAGYDSLVLACGPTAFLKMIQSYSLEFNVPTQISLEKRMACGVGACLGCVCKTSGEWPVKANRDWPVQTCLHGPVFWANQIVI